ncbi:MAG: hypothetical protein COU90_01845 [Candidatus Ryanbacteria bacterium CG10_big_fil_rev_8_21_14_0_10_43_42]|uniref:Uncharacterized protein n=1 Tax=Candidatus Ryanbacteria bacterium CG10_big_fil_rev_8_21_14_0_10_43_42 TaxID=1974864 RepID=A0A2M8KXF3_9BACT|nr:MAG: hypothetical protein COU90_01845 [Candidatus Ryanbacteria bacterium CG10_big_fil_rev_8_21_14_0_10_43_42]
MKTEIKIIGGIIIAGLFVWGGIFFLGNKNAEVPANGDGISMELPPKPSGYDILNKNDVIIAEIPEDRRVQYEDEFEETLQTITEHPDSFLAWMNLATIKNAFGDYEGAEKVWLYATEISPNQGRSLVNLGDLYWNKLKNYPRAEWAYIEAIDRDPVNARAYRDLASLYQFSYTEKKDMAINILLLGIENSPDNEVEFLALAGLWAWENGDITDAIGYYERYLELNPDDNVARADLVKLRSLR